MVRNNIQEFASKNVNNQNGFMNPSYQTILLTFYEKVSSNLDRRRPVNVVYLDFAKAFNTVSHRHVMYKLRSISI